MEMLRKAKSRVAVALVCALAMALGLAFGLPARRTASAEAVPVSASELETTINSAEADGEYTLSEDVKTNITLTPAHNITLDLGTHTITGKVTVNGTGTLTIKNGTITGNGSGYVIENHGTLTLGEEGKNEGSLTVNGGSSSSSLIANKVGGSALTILSGTYTSTFIAIKNETTSTLTIEGGDFLAEGAQSVQNWGEATISEGTFTGVVDMLNTFEEFEAAQDVYVGDVPDGHWEYGTHLDTLEGQKLTVNGGTFKEITGWIAEAQTAFLNIGFNSNITVSAAKLENSLPKNYITEGSVLSYAEGKYVVKTGTPAFSFTDNVKVGIITKPATEAEQEAHPGIDSYEWQQSYAVSYEFENYEAVRALLTSYLLTSYFAQEGHNSAVIRLIDDYTGDIVVDFSGKTVEIDGYATDHTFHGQIKVVSGSIGKLNPMNDYTFTNETAGKAVIYVENGAEMTIGGHSKIERAGNYYAIENYGTLTIGGAYNAGKYVTVTHTGSNATSSLIANKTGGKMTIDGGTFTTDFIAVKNETTSTLTIKSGTFNAEGAQSVQNWGEATIEGGTYNGIVSTLKTIEEIETAEAGGKTTITAGTYTKISGYVGVDDVAYENMAVNSQISIEGAITVKEAPYSAYVAEGWSLTYNEAKTNFTVTNTAAKAAISGSVTAFHTENAKLQDGKQSWDFKVEYHFATLTDALKVNKSGIKGVVKLLDDLTENVTLDFAVTLNLNGHVLTGNGGVAVTITADAVHIEASLENSGIQAASGYVAIYVANTVKSGFIGYTSLTVTGSDDHAAIENHGTVTIYGDKFVVNHTGAVAVENFGALTIDGGTYHGSVIIRSDSTVKVTRGTFDAKIFASTDGKSDAGYVEGAISIAPSKSKGRGFTIASAVAFTKKEYIPDARYFDSTDNLPVKEGEYYLSYKGSSASVAAHIGNIGYATLQDAVDDATNGAEIILENDVTEDIVVNFGTLGNIKFTITIDHKLTNRTATHTITVSGTGTLTLIGTGTVDNTAEGKAALEIENGANVVIGNDVAGIALMALDGTKLSFTHSENVGPTIENAGTLEINDAEVLAAAGNEDQPIIVNKSEGTLTIENIKLGEALTGETKTTTQQAIQNWGNATLNGGDYNGQVIQCSETGSSSEKKLEVKGGNYAGAVYAATGSTEGGTVEKVETHEGNNGIEIAPESGKDITFSSEEIIPDKEYFNGAVPEVNEDGSVTVVSPNEAVASITIDEEGEEVEYFKTLEAAIAHAQTLYGAQEGAHTPITITLTNDVKNEDVTIPGGVKIILDLNGHTIEGTGNGVVLTVQESAELTIKSSEANGTITGSSDHYVIQNHGNLTIGEKGGDNKKIVVTNTGNGPASTIRNDNTLVINSGTYNHAVEYVLNQENTCNAVKNEPDASLTINGGTFTNAILAYGTTTINGGTFEQPITGGNNVGNDKGVNTTGKLTITGGDFKSVVASYVEAEIKGSPNFEHQVQLYNKGTISGGTFTTKKDVTVSLVVAKNEETADTDGVIITGGEFNQQVQAKAGLKIEGGTFNSSVVAMRKDNNAPYAALEGSVSITGGTFKDVIGVYQLPADYSGDIHGVLVIDPAEQVKFEVSDPSNLPAAKYFAEGTDLPVKVGEKYISGNQNVVASVGSVGYTTLQAALDAAKNGETIKLAASTSGSFTIEKDITIDFGEFFLNGDGTSHTLTIASGHEVTLTGTTGGVCGNGNFYTVQNFGTLTIENGVYKNENATHTVGGTITLIANKVGGTLTIKDGTFSGMIIAVKNETEATLTIEDGTFTGTTTETALGVAVQNWGKAELKGGTYEGIVGQFNTEDEENSGALKADANKKLVIKGGEYEKISGFIATGDTIAYENPMFSSNVSIEGEISVKNAVPAGYVAKGYSLDMIGDEESFKVVNEEAVASANSIKPDLVGIGSMFGTNYNFSTVADAIAFASKHSTGSDVNVSFLTKELTEAIVINDGKDYTFTLNGGTLTVAEGNAVRVENGSLTLRADNETIISTTANRTAAIYVAEGAKLSLGVKLTVQGPDDYYVIENHGELDLTNAAKTTIKNTNKTESNASLVDNEGTLTVGNTTVAFETDYVAIKNATNGTLTINGGTFTSDRFAVWSYGEVTINGGTFNGEVASVLKANDPDGENNDDVKLTITAGTFNGAINGYTYDFKAEGDEQQANDPAGVIEIAPTKAGDITLSEVPNAQYFATNWVAEKQGETYKVVEGTYYAMIDGVGYTTLQAALDDALDGQTVTVLADVKEDLVVSGNKNITLDLGTHTITSTGEAVVLTVEKEATLTILGDEGSAITGYAGHYTIENLGTLTIGDAAKEHASIAVDNLAKGDAHSSTVRNYGGTLTINGGTYKNSDTSPLAAIKNEPNSTLTINGGTFGIEGQDQSGQLQLLGTATINGGIFNAIVFSDYQTLKDGSIVHGDVAITDGTFKAQTQAFGDMTINGGTFEKAVYAFTNGAESTATDPHLTIKTGTFKGAVGVLEYGGSWATVLDTDALAISGGTFANIGKLSSKSLALEEVLVQDGDGYAVKAKEGATNIIFGRSATEFEADTLAEGKVCYRTEDGTGDWLVVTIEEFIEIAKANITAFHNNLLASQVYSEKGTAKLKAILDEALKHIADLTDVKEINTHLETAKANMRAVLNKEQEEQLQKAIEQAVKDIETFATGLNENLTATHAIVKAEIEKIKAAETELALAAIYSDAQAAIRSFNDAIERAVEEFHIYAVTQGIDFSKEPHDACDRTYSANIRKAADYDDITTQLGLAKAHVDEHVNSDRQTAITNRQAFATKELKEHAEALGFTINDVDTANNIEAYNNGITAIGKATESVDAVNDALSLAKLAITEFHSAIENGVLLVTNYAISHGIDVNKIATEISDIRTKSLNNTQDAEVANSILHYVQAATKKVDELVKANEDTALTTRKGTAQDEVDAMGTKYPGDDKIKASKKTAKDTITGAKTLDAVNAAVEKAKSEIDLRVAQLDAIAEIDKYATETCKFSAEDKENIEVWQNAVDAIESAGTIEAVTEQRELALLAIAAFNNELLNAEVRARAYATSNGIDLDKTGIPDVAEKKWGEWIHETVFSAKKSSEVEGKVSDVKTKVNTYVNNALQAAKNSAINELKSWALNLNEKFTAEHPLIKDLCNDINTHATSVTDVAARLSDAQNKVQNLYNAIKHAETELELYALRSGIDLTGEHKTHLEEHVKKFYTEAKTEADVTRLLEEAKTHIDTDLAGDEATAVKNAKAKVKEYLETYVKATYGEEAGAQYLLDSKVAGFITAAVSEIGGDTSDEPTIKTREELTEAMQKFVDQIDVRIAQIKAVAELDARVETLKGGKNSDAYTTNVEKINAATGKEDVEAALRTALLAVEDFHNAVLNTEVRLRAYAVSQGVDITKAYPDVEEAGEETLEKKLITDSIETAKNDDELESKLTEAKKVIDKVRDANADAALDTRKGTAKTELENYAKERFSTYANIKAYKDGVSAIDNEETATIDAVNDALTKAMGEIDVYYNLYLDALLSLRTHSAAYGHDLGDEDHAGILAEVTGILDAATDEATLKTAIANATAKLDEHIQKHDDEVELAEYIEDKVTDLKFYAVQKNVPLSDKSVTDGITALKAVTIGEDYATLALAKEAVDAAYTAATDEIDKAAAKIVADEQLAAQKETVRHSLQVYAATKGVTLDDGWDATINSATAETLTGVAAAIKKSIDDEAADIAADEAFEKTKSEAEHNLMVYAAARDVEFDEAWSTKLQGATDVTDLETKIEEVKAAIDGKAALVSAKAEAVLALRIYAASVGVPADAKVVTDEETKINAAADVAAVATALTNAKTAVGNYASTEGTATKYLVVFVADGKVVSVQSIVSGGSAVKPADPVVYGKTFKNWEGTYTNVTADVVITAVFEEATIITDAKNEITTWLNEYLDDIIGKKTARSVASTSADEELLAKLKQVYSEDNANLVMGYYNEALSYIENAENDADVEYAKISFQNNVSAVDILEELVSRPVSEGMTTGEIVGLVILAVAVLGVAAALAVVGFGLRRKNRD